MLCMCMYMCMYMHMYPPQGSRFWFHGMSGGGSRFRFHSEWLRLHN